MVDGKRVDFAEVCKEIITNPERGKSVSANKSVSSRAKSDMVLSKRIYEVLKEGEVKWDGFKMRALGLTQARRIAISNQCNFLFVFGELLTGMGLSRFLDKISKNLKYLHS